jgi:hypothetical protein
MKTHPVCYTSSSIGPCPDLHKNFLQREETVSIAWDDAMDSTRQDNSFLRVMHQCEPPEVLDVIDRLIENHKYYDLILAWDERVLRACSNSVFITESACSWLPRKWDTVDPLGHMNYGDGVVHKNPVVMHYEGCDVSRKRFAVSFLTSSKRMFPGQILRQEIYENLPEKIGELDVWKHRSPPVISDKRTVLEPYMFTVIPENTQHNGYYSEKVVDSFVARTFPLYWGCPNLAEYFNPDGFMTFSDYGDLIGKLESLSPEFYQSRKSAIEENFRIALKGVHQWDQIEEAISDAIRRKHQEARARTEPTQAPAPKAKRFLRRPR